MTDASLPKIAFIGLGLMGAPMASHLLKAGHEMHLYSRSRGNAGNLIAGSGIWHDTPAEAAEAADIVITMVGLPSDVEGLYLAPSGLLDAAKKGTLLIDMTTSSPSLAIRIAEVASTKGLWALDAPVSGGVGGAQLAKLSIMVGGSPEAYAKALPVFEKMGANIQHQGGPGAGQHTKMVNQTVIAGTILGVAEGLAYAKAAGLDREKVMESIATGAAGSVQLAVMGNLMLKGDYSPGFMITHFVKDMTIAMEEGSANGLDLVALKTALKQFGKLVDAGLEREGTQALAKAYIG